MVRWLQLVKARLPTRCPMLEKLSYLAAADSSIAALSPRKLILTPLLVRVLALAAVMVLAHLS